MVYVKIKGKKFKVQKRDVQDMLAIFELGFNHGLHWEEVRARTNFIGMKRLYLANQDIGDVNEIEGLKNLTDLENLSLQNNRLTEIKGLETLSNLKILNLHGNQIEEIKGLENLANLRYLHINNNLITKIQGLEELSKLQWLDLGGNKIKEIESLEKLQELESLDLNNQEENHKITEIKGLKNLKKLKYLKLFSNEIIEIAGLENNVNLQDLDLSINRISEIKGIRHLNNLKSLGLNGNQITEIKGLENLDNLQRLELSRNQILEIKGLDNIWELEHLELSVNQIKEVKGLQNLSKLETLDIGDTPIPYNIIESLGGIHKLGNYIGKAYDPQKFVKYCRENLRGKEREIGRRPPLGEETVSESLADPTQIPLPFKAYQGTEPFVFTSYAHNDKQHVYPIIDSLNKDGINIWYDQGIPVSENWKKSIAVNLERCTAFLVFISPHIIKSEFVKKEIDFALRKKKPFISVYLQETKLPVELDFEIPAIQALLKYLMPETGFYDQLRETLYEKLNG